MIVALYINEVKADLADDGLILFNYLQSDIESPAAVKNSYSQQIELPGTPVNNQIFNDYFRNDRLTTSSMFNALTRTPFTLFNEAGEILESGYCKLDRINRKAYDVSYTISLFGGLGSFLYGLMVDDDGNKKTLADLNYTGAGVNEFNFLINKGNVKAAWGAMNGQTAAAMWQHVNFAPCYNGIPSGNFAADKAICPTNTFGVANIISDADGTFRSRNGSTIVKLSNKYDEWAVKDLRSYMQRPVIRVKSIIDAICDNTQNGGYDVILDGIFFNVNNKYYQDLWMTLPMLNSIKVPPQSGSEDLSLSFTGVLESINQKQKLLTNGAKGMAYTYDIQATLRHSVTAQSVQPAGTQYMAVETTASGNRTVVFYQLLAYDDNDVLVGGSNVVAVSSSMLNASRLPASLTTEAALTLLNETAGYTPKWNPTGNLADVAGDMILGNLTFADGSTTGVFTGADISLHTTASNVYRVMVECLAYSFVNDDVNQTSLGPRYTDRIWPGEGTTVINGYNAITVVNSSVTYSVNSMVGTDSPITKSLLLGGTASPADYLLSYCKMFGLNIICDSDRKRITISTRNSYYQLPAIDLQGLIDRASMVIEPYALIHRWYDFGLQHDDSDYIDTYEQRHGLNYGVQRVNTGFDFDLSANDVMSSVIFRNAAEVLESNKYYVNIMQQGRFCPSPFLDGGQFTLWGAGDSRQFDIRQPSEQEATVTYFNNNYRGYDYGGAPKIQLHDSEGKGSDGSNILLIFTGSIAPAAYNNISLTDDNYLMTLLNDGQPCWLMNQPYSDYKIGAFSNNISLPVFRRYDNNVVTKSLDFGTPLEVGNPMLIIANPDNSTIYNQGWKSYITDRYNVDARIVRCKVNLRKIGIKIDHNVLSRFFFFDNSYWVLIEVNNHSITTDDLTECTFIKVQDMNNYIIGQTY